MSNTSLKTWHLIRRLIKVCRSAVFCGCEANSERQGVVGGSNEAWLRVCGLHNHMLQHHAPKTSPNPSAITGGQCLHLVPCLRHKTPLILLFVTELYSMKEDKWHNAAMLQWVVCKDKACWQGHKPLLHKIQFFVAVAAVAGTTSCRI